MPLPIPDSAVEERAGIRAGDHVGPTSGLAPGFAQANLAMLPGDLALDFLRFCVRNPKPCPLLEVTDTGSARPATMARDADLRTDLRRDARQRADRHNAVLARRSGGLSARLLVHLRLGAGRRWATACASDAGSQRSDVRHESRLRQRRTIRWTASRVDAAVRAGRHPPCLRNLVTLSSDAWRPGACRKSSRTRHRYLNAPDFGDPVRLAPDEIPVFWACGVTAQMVALEARPSLAIFHAPGHMFITDRPHVDFHRQEEGHDNP